MRKTLPNDIKEILARDRRVLVARGEGINCRNEHGQSLIRRRVQKRSLDLILGLITLGGDINARDDTAQTPLFDAVASSRRTFSRLWNLLVPDRGSLRRCMARSSVSPGGSATKSITTAA